MASRVQLTIAMLCFALLTLLASLGCASQVKVEAMQRNLLMQAETRNWQQTMMSNNISAYESFLRHHPNSPNAGEAKRRIAELQEDRDWKTAETTDSAAIYEEFLRKYPKSRHDFQAKARLEVLRRELAPWKTAQEKNTIEAYQEFINQYPKSTYAEKARRKIIDLEVADIMRTQPGKMPPPEKVSTVPGRNYSLVNIHNDTNYTLTIRYSGPDSFKMKFAPGEKREVKFQVGNYRVTASADSLGVKSFAGEQSYEGANYKSRFYEVRSGTTPVYQPVEKLKLIPEPLKPIPEPLKPIPQPLEVKPSEMKPLKVMPVPTKKIAPAEEKAIPQESSK